MKSTTTITARAFIISQLVHAKVPNCFTNDIIVGLHEAKYVYSKPYAVMVISEFDGVFYLLEVKMYKDMSMSIEEVAASQDFFTVLEQYICTN